MPRDELNTAPRKGLHFGYPFCHQGDVSDPELGKARSCSEFQAPARPLDAHVAAIGMRFYTGRMFPEEYRNQIFVAEHGSWNRSIPQGYRLSLVKLDGNKVVSYTPLRGRLAARAEAGTGWRRDGGGRLGPPGRRAGDAGRRAAGVRRSGRRDLSNQLQPVIRR